MTIRMPMERQTQNGAVMLAIRGTSAGISRECIPLPRDSGSLHTLGSRFDMVLAELHACCDKHTHCSLPSSLPGHLVGLAPRRLLQLNMIEDTLRLITVHEDVHIDYAALSYCWGGDQQLKLTKHSKTMLEDWMSLSELPQLHRDAVRVCKRVGLAHLWIDALCIRQDDENDWTDHSARLAGIYSGAYVTIQALACSNTHESLFSTGVDDAAPANGNMPIGSGQNNTFTMARSGADLGHHHASFNDRLDPLARRAWAFQESAFSRRVISFTSHELQWRCRTAYACECGKPADVDFARPMLYDGMPPISRQEAYALWYLHVQRYTWTELTRPSDYLVAISSLAVKVAQSTGDAYLAGIWLSDIAYSLTWITEQEDNDDWTGDYKPPSSSCAEPYRAPSFSWASVRGVIVYPFDRRQSFFEPQIKAITATTEAKSELNPLGEVVSAELQVHGQVTRCHIHRTSPWSRTTFTESDVKPLEKGLTYYWDCDLAILENSQSHPCRLVHASDPFHDCHRQITVARHECHCTTTPIYRLIRPDSRDSTHIARASVDLGRETDPDSVHVGVHAQPLYKLKPNVSLKVTSMPRDLQRGDTVQYSLEVTCLRIATARDDGTEWLTLLGPSPSKPGCYERLGMLRIRGDSVKSSQLQEFLKRLPTQAITII